ncbi:MAG: DUF72 domain-containing protein [Acidobacteriia bacterium]|jgi:uncharacterized protein YecE (DUF72 family)|nr:DUF72 domain-containing protein [Terriglobia bacterium]
MSASAAQTDRAQGRVLVGPAGWSYPDWAGVVYPARRPRGFHEAAYLAEFFDTIEINTSFYQPLRAASVRQWIEQVQRNPNFLFTAKLWQRFTHETARVGTAEERAVREGFDVLQAAGRLGAVLLQFPFSFHNTKENRQQLRTLLNRFADYPLVVEVRHASWNEPAFYDLLEKRGVGFCNLDQPILGRAMQPSQRATAPIGYVRLHGRRYDTWFADELRASPEERYNYLYSLAELKSWVERIRAIRERTRTTFVITNNHFGGKAVVNALQLLYLLKGERVSVPELLRHHYPELEEIARQPAQAPTLFPQPPM